jgi:hypothetical protein
MLKKNKEYFSYIGLFFLLIFICFLSTKIIKNNEYYEDSCCYYEYLNNIIKYSDINPFYCKGRRWRYHRFNLNS